MPRPPLALRLAWSEIRGAPGFALFFALGMALGLLGFVALDAFRSSLDATLELRSRALLGADLQLVARRPIAESERALADAALGPGSEALREAELPPMVASGQRSRLAQVRAVETAFPLRGTLELRGAGRLASGAGAALERERIAWLAPELLAQLGVGVGDEVRVGRTAFRVADVLERDNGS